MMEIIFTVGLDFIPAAVKILFLISLSITDWADIDLELFMVEMGFIDLQDAYRYVPVDPVRLDTPLLLFGTSCYKNGYSFNCLGVLLA